MISSILGVFWLSSGDRLHADQPDTQVTLTSVDYPGAAFRDGVQAMVDQYEYASVSAPRSVSHRAKLVQAYTMLWCFGFVPRDEITAKLNSQAAAAVKLDGEDAGAQTAMGIAKLSQWEWAAAEKHLAKAV